MHVIELTDPSQMVDEKERATLRMTFENENGDPVVAESITAMTLTLTNEADDSIINARDAQSILNENGGTVANENVDGVIRAVLTLILSEQDNPFVGLDPRSNKETHAMVIAWDAAGIGKQLFRLVVLRNRSATPALQPGWIG